MSDTDPTRLLPLAGTVNFRDLGGYPTEDGSRVRWRRLFRADSLNRLTEEDRGQIRHLGVATVIDLRTTAEVEEGRFPVDEVPVAFHHLPFMESVPDPEAFQAMPGLLASTYVDMLDEAGDKVAAAVTVMADPANQPAIFHCTAGKDRTGVLSAVLLGLLGVPDEIIIEDYALSAHAMAALKERLAERYPDFAEQILEAGEMFSAAPQNMERLIDVIRERHGGFEDWATSLGITSSTVASLRSSLLDR